MAVNLLQRILRRGGLTRDQAFDQLVSRPGLGERRDAGAAEQGRVVGPGAQGTHSLGVVRSVGEGLPDQAGRSDGPSSL